MPTKAIQKNNSEADHQPIDDSNPKLDDRFIQNIKGKDFVLYAGVLDLATQKGLQKLEVELLQYPTKKKVLKQYAGLWQKEQTVKYFQTSVMLTLIIALQ